MKTNLTQTFRNDCREILLYAGGTTIFALVATVLIGALSKKPLAVFIGLIGTAAGGGITYVTYRSDEFAREIEAAIVNHPQALEAAKQNGIQIGRNERDTHAAEAARVKWESDRATLVANHRNQLAALNDRIREAESERSKWQTYHKTTIDSLNRQLEGKEAQLRAEYDLIIADLKAKLQTYETQRSAINRNLEKIRQWEVDSAREQGHLKMLEEKVRNHSRELDNTKREYDAKYKALQTTYQQQIKELSDMLPVQYKQGYAKALDEAKTERERDKLRIAILKTKLDKKLKYEKFEDSLPELDSFIAGERKPLIVVGSQGSGKALLSVKVAEIYADGAGIIPFVLDISEAGNPKSSWHRLGIPATDNPYIFLEFLLELEKQVGAKSNSLPFRNDKEKYDNAPAIVPIVDEALTAFDNLEKEGVEKVRECLRAFESRGSKRKVFPLTCTTDNQIQNLKPQGISLWNTGVFRAYYIIYLNDGLMARVSKEELESNPTLKEYLEVHEGNFVSGIEITSFNGKSLRPFRHVSHHGKQRGNSVRPVRIPEVNLADPYPWMPRSFREIYSQYHRATDDGGMAVASGGTAVANGRGGNGVQPLELSLHKETTDSVAVANNGVSTATADIDPETIEAILDCKMRGMNQADTIYKIWGMKKNGRSPRWKEYREIYNRVIEENGL